MKYRIQGVKDSRVQVKYLIYIKTRMTDEPQRSQRKALCSQKEFPLKQLKINAAQLLTYIKAFNKTVNNLGGYRGEKIIFLSTF